MIKIGARVKWAYDHSLNGKSYTTITKFGRLIRLVSHKKNYRGEQLAIVSFDGNKNVTRVPFSEIEAVEE